MYNNIAYLKGESEFSLIIKLVSKENTNSIRLDISIISDWYNASVILTVHTDKLENFISELSSENSSVSFYDDTGSFELIIKSDGLGHFYISGNLSKSMYDENNLTYSFETDNYSFKSFLFQITSLLNE